ncbi:L,D-transpeptidase [Nocardioides nematodiphilus]|uniref:L,D-transpeptidase n=1 Tax=Nocardioides nematodiphilus TaxID=2849669 RepID=UPI001CD98C7D|nr:L,D-transpeptidase [Nocardioides nematodiphilus]MCA1984559.1 L,D-transpeptidase [Nocardioides nematodiphilus]
MSRHRADVRPRWGRIGLLGTSALVTLVAVLAGFGVISGSGGGPTVAHDPADAAAAVAQVMADTPSTSPSASASVSATPSTAAPASASASPSHSPAAAQSTALPPDSGSGRRAVFSQTEQRVWIVGDDGKVERTYLASGSVEDNLRPGTYHVYGKSRWATGIEDSGVMQYFVRFAHGTDSGASIGFHSIPTKDGKPLETIAQLGTPLSHGCIRQKTEDAIAMWDFADIGTEVVVVA